MKKKIILVGFSLGSAIALKMLEYLEGIEFAMLFYGFPPLAAVVPEKVQAKSVIYCGTLDNVKHLSDPKTAKSAKQAYSGNKNIEIIELEDAHHGFMNPNS